MQGVNKGPKNYKTQLKGVVKLYRVLKNAVKVDGPTFRLTSVAYMVCEFMY